MSNIKCSRRTPNESFCGVHRSKTLTSRLSDINVDASVSATGRSKRARLPAQCATRAPCARTKADTNGA